MRKLYRQRNGGRYSLIKDLLGFYDMSIVLGPGDTAVKQSTCAEEAHICHGETDRNT